MKIGLDTTQINNHSGIGRYSNEILKHLCTLYPEHHFFAIGPTPRINHNYPNITHIPFSDTNGLIKRLNFAINITPLLKKYSIDLFHIMINFGIYNKPCPVVTTIHDLLPLKYPHLRSKKIFGLLYKYYIPSLSKKSDMVIADSYNTQRDLKECYGITNNITTVYLGYNDELFDPRPSSDKKVMKLYGLQPGYLLFVGNLTTSKNLDVIIRALKILNNKGIYRKLVLVGEHRYGSKQIFNLIESLSLSEYIIACGYVSDEHLGAFYRQSQLFLLPSKYEGFGLPVLEAMTSGTPVIVSSAGSLPELVDNKKYICSPDSPDEWAKKIIYLTEDKTAYEEARIWGFRQSQKFSWEKCVKYYMKIYNSIFDMNR